MNKNLRRIDHTTQLCVVGGGMAGLCAAVSAARHGTRVVLMQDRAVLGGNASSEIRMWICGAHGENNRETGILEELALETYYRNPYRTYPIWDSILFDLVKREKNLTLLMNCSCNDAEMDGDRIVSVTGWQGTTQTWHCVTADYFADCSGDSILAPLTGAAFMQGREARTQYDESIAPVEADRRTMGNSCLIQAREMPEKRTFIPPEQIRRFTKDKLAYRHPNMQSEYENYWYMELGGQQDTIGDAEEIRDELVRVAYGMWDYVKNSGNCNADNWELDFVGFLPGKRESRRYIGDYVMTENDVRAEGRFDDLIAYGGWTMDDHDPAGIDTTDPPNIFHPAPSPFGIPYRCVYSKNIGNLFFAGRNISVTHCAMSATRVMATCATLGQAVGTAAAIAARYGISPRQVYADRIRELQKTLMDDDCWLPFHKNLPSDLTRKATLIADGEFADRLLDGIERPDSENDHQWVGRLGDSLTFTLDKPGFVSELRLVFDSDLNRETINDDHYLHEKLSIANIPLKQSPVHPPKTLVRSMTVEVRVNGEWTAVPGMENNHQRLVKLPVERDCEAIRLTLTGNWGNDSVGIQAVDIQ